MALAGGPSGNLRVSMPYSLAIWLLPEIINDFTERYPDIECEFDLSMLTASDTQGTPFDIMLRFGRNSDYNLPPTGEQGNGGHSGAVVQELVRLDNYLYASDRYLERHGEPLTPQDLSAHQCLRTTIDDEHSHWMLHNGSISEMVPVSGHLAANNMSIAGTLAGLDRATRMPHCRALDPPIIKRTRSSACCRAGRWTRFPSTSPTRPASSRPRRGRSWISSCRCWARRSKRCGRARFAGGAPSASAILTTGPGRIGDAERKRQNPHGSRQAGFSDQTRT